MTRTVVLAAAILLLPGAHGRAVAYGDTPTAAVATDPAATELPRTTTSISPATDEPAKDARALLDRWRALEDGPRRWTDRHQRLRLRVVDRSGGERVREADVRERRRPDGEIRARIVFQVPADIRCLAFLGYTRRGEAPKQWLYRPSNERVRAITPRSRDERFATDTDFTYRDLDLLQQMPLWSAADAAARLRGTEQFDGATVEVVELEPTKPELSYPRVVLWLGRDPLVPRRIEFHRGGGPPVRRISQHEVRDVGRVPVAHRIEAETPADGTRTVVDVLSVEVDGGIPEAAFEPHALGRCEL